MAEKKEMDEWDLIVKPKSSLFTLNLAEVWAYKDLIMLMVKRDFTAIYKQTILGPIWMFVQPLFTTAIYTFTFSSSAKLSTDQIPPILFYIIGQTFWNYFADCLNKTSNTFIANSTVFGKVYFPRLVMPFSTVLSSLIKLGLQILLMLVFYFYYFFNTDQIHPQWHIVLLPLYLIILGLFSLSLGVLFSSFTTKYRDFTFLLAFAVQLLMFASCVVFPVSMYSQKIQQLLMYNPIVSCMEAIKYALTGHGYFSWYHLSFGALLTSVVLLVSIVIFNRTEKSFMDTV
jgi:lipopolysaccharide transport system permease protein